MSAERRLLFTPGPLTTTEATRRAMLADWGSREPDFIALTAELRRRLLAVVNGEGSHVAMPLQGSGTFIVEAAIATLVGPQDKLLVLVNGAYGERMVAIAKRLGRTVEALRWPEDQPSTPPAVERALAGDPAITHVALVHCETTTGLLNPLEAVAAVVATRRTPSDRRRDEQLRRAAARSCARRRSPRFWRRATNASKACRGIGFASIEKNGDRAATKGVAPSLSLDLHDQWRGFETNGQWRFTPPVQVVAALVEALRLLEAEGGRPARLRRYQENFEDPG